MPISQYILDAHHQTLMDLRLRNRWMLRIRWYYLLILGTVAIGARVLSNTNTDSVREYSLLVGAGLIMNAVLWSMTTRRLVSKLYYRCVAILQLLLDIALGAYVVYSQAGIHSRATALFAIPILVSGILLRGQFAFLAALASAAAYAAAIILYVQRYPDAYEMHETFVPIAFYTAVFLILAAIVSRYSRLNEEGARERSYGELLAMLRHQLNNPTSVIAALVEMLEHSPAYSSLPAKDRQYIAQLKYENKRQNNMISNLLQAAAPKSQTSLKKDNLHLVEVLALAGTSAAMAHKRVDDLDLDLLNVDIQLPAQIASLRMAFENILDNAFRYSQPKTKVTISAEETAKQIIVRVRDHGTGISDKQQKELFKFFTKFEDSAEDTQSNDIYASGLGLYVSKAIIERHGGKLELKSQQNKGTEVIIHLEKEIPSEII